MSPLRRMPSVQRTPNPEKLAALLAARRMSFDRLARLVGPSTLYSALMFRDTRTQWDALTRVCVALRCSVDDLTEPATNPAPMHA